LICCPADLRKFVKDFEKNGIILVEREPEFCNNGKPSTFLTEKNKQSVKIVRK
jgi:hypothetical protein